MATNRIERVLRHDGIVAVLDMTGDASSAAEPTPAPASVAGSSGFGGSTSAPMTPSAAAPVAAPASPSGGGGHAAQVAWVGDETWRPIVMEAVKLRQIANEPSVRVEVGDHKVMVSGDYKHVIGVVFIKGHPVVKSVVRMVRQLLRSPGGSSQGL